MREPGEDDAANHLIEEWHPTDMIYPEWVAYLRGAVEAYEIPAPLWIGWLAVHCKIAARPGEKFGWITRTTYNPFLLERITAGEAVELLRQIWEWHRNRAAYQPLARPEVVDNAA